MANDFDFYDDVGGLERYLNLPAGSLASIPIYARVPAVDAIIKLQKIEKSSLFRPGLYYIVLVDLVGQTQFNQSYGDAEGTLRIEWFQTCVISTIGEIDIENYVAFSKTIGDAALIIFSSFRDVLKWSRKLTENLKALSQEYPGSIRQRLDLDNAKAAQQCDDFSLRARRLAHLGEVVYDDSQDPLSLAVSRTFKMEKNFSEQELGCTQAVADAIAPKLRELGVSLRENRVIRLAGSDADSMTYYVVPRET